MTPQEILQECERFAKLSGAKVSVSIVNMRNNYSRDKGTIEGSAWFAYPTGERLSVQGNDWEAVFEKLDSEMSEAMAKNDVKRIEDMALEIIRITAQFGECTDAALRGGNFNHDEVEAYGERACIRADEMASNGPFSILALAGANAA